MGLAQITLRKIRVSRAEVHDRPSSADANPMNRLVPYLDLYGRLSDDELARLAGVPASVAGNLRRQVVQVDRALARFTDLLPRLSDAELVRLTGATPKTIRFWRLCQPRVPMPGPDARDWSVGQAAETLGRVQASDDLPRRSSPNPMGATMGAAMGEEEPLDSGAPLDPRHAEAARTAYRMPAAERDAATARRTLEPAPSHDTHGLASSFPVDLSRPRTGRTQEMPAATAPAPRTAAAGPPPEQVQRQQAVSQQMKFSGAPFPGYDENSGPIPVEVDESDDGIFIGLELPDPHTLAQPGRRD